MFHFRLLRIASGKLRLVDEVQRYQKMISPWAKLSLQEVSRSRESQPALRQQKDAASILKHCAPPERLILLDEGGEQLSSELMAKWLKSQEEMGFARLCLGIGGAYGWPKPFDWCEPSLVWSLSPLTFAHEHVPVIVAEQLYRALSIIRGHPYHNS